MKHLVNSALRPATRLSYMKSWQNFTEFLTSFNCSITLPIDERTVALYITHLWRSDLKPSSIRTYICAISYFHKINRQNDPTASYFVKQVLKGASRNKNWVTRTLKPFTKLILQEVISIVNKLYETKYEQCLFKKQLFLFPILLASGQVK